MKYHKHLSAERVRRMPWRTQVGMIASELSRVRHLSDQGGGPEVTGCLHRARELLGVLDSVPGLPREAAPKLAELARELSLSRLSEAPAKAETLYRELMALYSHRSVAP
ncbi:MAG: hypothetical protein ABII00_16245 [Elusimicrobiota bacterium]